MFEHADRNNPVEFLFEIAIILQAEFNPIGEAVLGGVGASGCELLLRQRNAGDTGVAMVCQVQRQAAPTRTDVEHARVVPD